jgi:HK97 family phage prohead protease
MQGTLRRIAQPYAVKFASELQDGQVLAWLSSNQVDHMGDVVEQDGVDYSAFMAAGGPVLWQHDVKHPVARTLRIGVVNGRLQALAQFPPPGTSSQGDECYRLIKAGIVTGTSIGFLPRQWELIDPRKSGLRFTETELCEFSFVSVPANRDALIIDKSYPAVAAPQSYCPRPPSTLEYAGTLAQRSALLHRDHPEIEEEAAAAERDAAISRANAEMTGHLRRWAIAKAWRGYVNRTHRVAC